MLNEIWVFDLSLAIWSIRTNHLRGTSYGYPGVVVSAEAFVTSATERRALEWTGTPTRLCLLLATHAMCRCDKGDGPRPLGA